MKAAIILARLDSKRFPNKALAMLGNKRLIDWVIDGVLAIPEVMPILATTDRIVDIPLIAIAKEKNIPYYTGNLDNVALRVVNCIQEFGITCWARVNGDSPFVQKELLISGFKLMEHQNLDFVTNLCPRTFPYGISVEVFSSKIFLSEYKKFKRSTHYEHITSYFYEHISTYNYYNLAYDTPSDSVIHLTVDSPDDLVLLNTMLSKLSDVQNFKWMDLIRISQPSYD